MFNELEWVYCGHCSGSGEGMYHGLKCRTCHGLGEVEVEVQKDFEEEIFADQEE
jgi:DnaJ-class molecular chaperone